MSFSFTQTQNTRLCCSLTMSKFTVFGRTKYTQNLRSGDQNCFQGLGSEVIILHLFAPPPLSGESNTVFRNPMFLYLKALNYDCKRDKKNTRRDGGSTVLLTSCTLFTLFRLFTQHKVFKLLYTALTVAYMP